jgi:hypothetical protein
MRSEYAANEALSNTVIPKGAAWMTPAPVRTVVRKSFLARLLGL